MATGNSMAMNEYIGLSEEALRLKAKIETIVGKEIFHTFCAACLTREDDDTHRKEGEVLNAFRCTKKGPKAPKVDRALAQMRTHVGVLKEFIEELGRTGWSVTAAEGTVKEVERWEEEGGETEEVEQLRARVEELEKDRRDLMNSWDPMKEELKATRMIIDSLREQVQADQPASAATSAASTPAAPQDV